MTDIVIPIADEPRNVFLPLALDLIAAHTPFRPVLIGAGTQYEWAVRERFTDYLIVNTVQAPNDAIANTNLAMRAAIDHPSIGNDFVWTNDDIFIHRDVTLDDIDRAGATARGSLAALADSGYYGRLNHHTSLLLREAGRPEHDYERHVPMIVDKTAMLRALDFGGQKRSVYFDLLRDEPVAFEPDVKLFVNARKEVTDSGRRIITGIPDGPFLSIADVPARRGQG